MKNIKDFANNSNINEKLIRAVIRQCGGWDSFRNMAPDVVDHGADGGFGNFIYHTATVAFYARNRGAINEMAQNMADDLGEGGIIELVRGFNCLCSNRQPVYTADEVGQTLYGSKAKMDTQIANALAWFALEEVARSFVDCIESEGE